MFIKVSRKWGVHRIDAPTEHTTVHKDGEFLRRHVDDRGAGLEFTGPETLGPEQPDHQPEQREKFAEHYGFAEDMYDCESDDESGDESDKSRGKLLRANKTKYDCDTSDDESDVESDVGNSTPRHNIYENPLKLTQQRIT